MSKELQFKVSAGLKNIIGRDLITDDFIAIFELVKNSFDAHATNVDIIFQNVQSVEGIIKIVDNGKGMNYDDLINKWLFVAYSAKKDGTEDLDYRDNIRTKYYYAGSKGIGRFSCDKLGSKLKMISIKDEESSLIHQIKVDWSKFEQNSKNEFISVNVEYDTLTQNPSIYRTGTTLEISELRNDSIWNAEKIIALKNSLAKLINPFSKNSNRQFKIRIIANEFVDYDAAQAESNRKINGLVENHLLEILHQKTIKIYSQISPDGKTIMTELSNNGVWLFRIIEENKEYNLLQDILVELFYLNRSAKNNFTRLMGVRNGEYGSVFLYKNGIRIYPYGEPGADPLQLDMRQQSRIGDYVGTSELIGRIEISGENEEFKETTSRGDGLIKNSSYKQLYQYFIDKVVRKLESFRRNILKYGIDLDEFENTKHSQEKIVRLIAGISSNDNIISIDFNPDLLAIMTETQEEGPNVKNIIKSIEKIALESDNTELAEKIHIVKNTFNDAILIADLAEEEIQAKASQLKEMDTQNLFLKSIRSQEFDDLVSFMHHAGIYAHTINSYLKNISLKLNRNIEISRKELMEIIRIISFEAEKILNITEFATKANFRLKTEEIETDLANYISQYIQNIVPSINNKTMEITFRNDVKLKFIKKFKPIEINILIDNMVMNSRKAKSTELTIYLTENRGRLSIEFLDNGIGIIQKNLEKIFDFGFTTTDGSGLGLYHVKQIVESMGGKIVVVNGLDNGVKFNILI